MKYRIVRDDDRYNGGSVVGVNTTRLCGGEYPAEFWVEGMTRDQADSLCFLMSCNDPGCTDLFYVDAPDEDVQS